MATNLKPRCGHSLTASSLDPGMTEVTMFGGTAESWAGGHDKQSKLANTTLLQFSELSLVALITPYKCK